MSSVLFRCLINCEQRIIIYMLHFQSNTLRKARGFVHTRVKSENMVQCGQRPFQILYETISVQNAAAQYDVFFSSSNHDDSGKISLTLGLFNVDSTNRILSKSFL